MLKSLTPSDIEQIKHDMNRRRAEALSRHAAEIMSLDSDQSEVEAFERSLDAFMKKSFRRRNLRRRRNMLLPSLRRPQTMRPQ